jgi:transposase
MENTDARKVSKEVQQELRNQIIRLRRQGRTNREIAQVVGVSEPHASSMWHKYQKGGITAVRVKIRGRRIGEKKTLSDEQEREIQRLVIDKMPDQLKLPFALWTREAIRQLIQQRVGIVMPIRTVGEYLKRWGFTVRKPIKRAYEQNPEEVRRWLQEQYPAIAAQAKRDKAEIYWGDETGIQTTAHRARGFAPKGKKPILRISAKKSTVSMVSAINNEGQMRFMMYKKGMTAKLLIKFMQRLIKDAKRKVYLILDNLRSHHSKEVKKWVQEHQNEIALYHLPSYSPELNPDEYLNNDLKGRVHAGVPARSEEELRRKTLSHMKSIAKRPHHVKKFFKHPSASYAA